MDVGFRPQARLSAATRCPGFRSPNPAAPTGIPDLPVSKSTSGAKDLVVHTGKLSGSRVSIDDNGDPDMVTRKCRRELTTLCGGECYGRRRLGRVGQDVVEQGGIGSYLRRLVARSRMPRIALEVSVRKVGNCLPRKWCSGEQTAGREHERDEWGPSGSCRNVPKYVRHGHVFESGIGHIAPYEQWYGHKDSHARDSEVSERPSPHATVGPNGRHHSIEGDGYK
jgi:hypothetical protein